MNGIEQIKTAASKAQEIVNRFTGQLEGTPDAVAARTEELEKLGKATLVAMIIGLEKPKTDKAFRVEDVIKEILEEPACAIYNYEQIATLVQQVLPEAKTSSKSVASYASKKKTEWTIVPRQKLHVTHDDLLAMASNG